MRVLSAISDIFHFGCRIAYSEAPGRSCHVGSVKKAAVMTYSRTQLTSTYMEFAKLQPSAKYTLATSGIEPMRFEELGSALDGLEIEGGGPYGHPELLEE